MFRNHYDNDITTFSPQGRLHQIEYAMEAVKQGSACVALRSNTHAVLLALQRRLGDELAGYQKKMVKIDDHIGCSFSGLTSDARVLSNFMRTECLQYKILFNQPLSTFRVVDTVADKAQRNTQVYGSRPYGVGFLVIGKDSKGVHLYEISPSGISSEYFAYSIGARSQTARTYLESQLPYKKCSLKRLISHGLKALSSTIPHDKNLELDGLCIAVIGRTEPEFRFLERDEVEIHLNDYNDVIDPLRAGDYLTETEEMQTDDEEIRIGQFSVPIVPTTNMDNEETGVVPMETD